MFLIVGGDSEIGAAYLSCDEGAGQVRRGNDPPSRSASRPTGRCSIFPRRSSPGSRRRERRSACVCAAVARLAACAADPEGTAHINVTQTLALVDKLLARGIYVLFLSTNQVFDGSVPQMPAGAPYSPVSEYGRQKARTETALRDAWRAARLSPSCASPKLSPRACR